jgi:hypothetical protein
MAFEIERDIYCHPLKDPPAHDKTSDVNLEVINFDSIKFTKKKMTSSEATYSIKIPNAESMGFRNMDSTILNGDFDNFILALNLVSETVCITTKSSKFPDHNVKNIPELEKSHVENKDGKTYINLEEYTHLQEKIHVGLKHFAKIDGGTIIGIFKRLQNVSNFSKNAQYDQNLRDAFKNYKAAMEDFERLFKFKYLFVALEKITNIDGKDSKGDDFDNKVSRLSKVDSNIVENWRCFYNRIKHIQTDSKDLKVYRKGQERLPDTLLEIRKCVQSILLSKLN